MARRVGPDLRWDVRVVYLQQRQRWWWNAWRASTQTELFGFADSRTEAAAAMYREIEMTRGTSLNEFSQLLAGLPGVVESLLRLHQPDDHGRCRGCTKAGTGLPEQKWPCSLHWFASAAQRETR